MDTEKVKINQYRAVIYACQVINTILKDKQIDDLDKKINDVKNLLISLEYDKKATEEEIKEVDELLESIKETG